MRIATSEANRPIPEKIATGTNVLLLDELLSVFDDDATEAGIGIEIRAAFCISVSPVQEIKTPALRSGLACRDEGSMRRVGSAK